MQGLLKPCRAQEKSSPRHHRRWSRQRVFRATPIAREVRWSQASLHILPDLQRLRQRRRRALLQSTGKGRPSRAAVQPRARSRCRPALLATAGPRDQPFMVPELRTTGAGRPRTQVMQRLEAFCRRPWRAVRPAAWRGWARSRRSSRQSRKFPLQQARRLQARQSPPSHFQAAGQRCTAGAPARRASSSGADVAARMPQAASIATRHTLS